MSDKLANITSSIKPILRKYAVEYAGIFGSYARGEEKPDSDVDLLVRLGHLQFGIWGLVGLKQDLEEALDKKVDVVSEAAINPRLAAKIKNDLIEIYVQGS